MLSLSLVILIERGVEEREAEKVFVHTRTQTGWGSE